MSRLGLGLGLTKGGIPPFNPLSLDPYLLFDTQSSMIGTFENPTLDLDPSDPDTLDVITATRSGVATYTDADGVIQSADPNTVRVDHVQGEELTPTKYQRVGYTDFSSGVTLDGVTKTNQSTPYGDGVLLTQDTSSGEHNINISVTSTGQHTFSLKVKPNGVTKFSLSLEFSSSNSEVVYDTVLETSGIQGSNVSDASIENLGNGWFLAKLTNDSTVSTARVRLRNNSSQVNYLGDGASGLFLANPQIEEGTTASDFVENTTGSPKFIAPATYGPRVPMILVEPSATNLVPFSDINSGWDFYYNDSNITQHTNDLGGVNAYVLSRIGSNQKTSLQHGFISGASTTNATASLFYKNIGEARFFQFWDTNLSNTRHVNVDTLTDDVFESDGSASITVLGNGWRRLEWTRPSNTVHNGGYMRLSLADSLGVSRNPDFSGTGGIAFAGIQLEEGSVATSYIPTSGSTVTRQADDLVIDGSDFTDFYNQSEGTVYTEVETRGYNGYLFSINDGSTTNRIISRASSANFFVSVGGVIQSSMSYTPYPVSGSLYRRAASYKANNFLLSNNGATAVSDSSGAVPSSLTRILIGSGLTVDTHLNGHIKRLIYWPYHSDSL